MIRTFRSKSLAELWNTGTSRRIDARMLARLKLRLDALNEANSIEELDLPGFNFHVLHGHNPTRYTLHVNGPWCVTFEFEDGDALRVDFEQYH